MTNKEILSRFHGVRKTGENSFLARCPCHNDEKASLSITRSEGRTLMHCFAGCGTLEICNAVGLEMRDLFDAEPRQQQEKPRWQQYIEGREGKRVADVYTYRDIDGNAVFSRVRTEPKGFVYGTFDGETFSYGLGGKRRRDIPAVFTPDWAAFRDAVRSGGAIFVSEGEKDCRALHREGLVSCSFGGSSDWEKPWAEFLRGAAVTVCLDNDAPGKKWGARVCRDLDGVAASVRMVLPVRGMKHGDIGDYFEAGGTAEGLLAMPGWDPIVPPDFSDVGQACVFADVYGDVVKYTAATKWLVYNGTVWQESEIKAQGLSQELTERQLAEARERVRRAQNALNRAAESGEAKAEKDLLKRAEKLRDFVILRRKTDKIRATLAESRPKLEIDVARLDVDGYLLNTPGGTVDLRTGEIKPHCPDDYCTKITTVAPDTANAGMFAEFMERVTVGDRELERYLQQVAGMCAVGKVLRENLIIAHGGGGNGKSTLFNLLARVLGDYSGALSAETLTANCRKNKSPEYAELRGKRLVIAAELEEGMRLDTAIVKKLCSTDPILAEKKYKDPFAFVPSHTVILYTNHLPKIGTTDKGTWDRIIAVPFNANFRGMEGEIKNYAEYLYHHCGGAVLTWVIEGAKRFIANDGDIAAPECVRRAVGQYKANNDWMQGFITECCEVGPKFIQKSGELYTRYKSYCDETGEYRRSASDFKQALAVAGYETRKTKAGAFVYGLRLMSVFSRVSAKW